MRSREGGSVEKQACKRQKKRGGGARGRNEDQGQPERVRAGGAGFNRAGH